MREDESGGRRTRVADLPDANICGGHLPATAGERIILPGGAWDRTGRSRQRSSSSGGSGPGQIGRLDFLFRDEQSVRGDLGQGQLARPPAGRAGHGGGRVLQSAPGAVPRQAVQTGVFPPVLLLQAAGFRR